MLVLLCIVPLATLDAHRVRIYRLDEQPSNHRLRIFGLDSPFPLALFYAQLILRRQKMKIWLLSSWFLSALEETCGARALGLRPRLIWGSI